MTRSSKLASLPLADQLNLFQMCNTHPYAHVVEMVARPRHEGGFSLKTNRSALCRFNQEFGTISTECNRLAEHSQTFAAQRIPDLHHHIYSAVQQQIFKEVAVHQRAVDSMIPHFRFYFRLQRALTRNVGPAAATQRSPAADATASLQGFSLPPSDPAPGVSSTVPPIPGIPPKTRAVSPISPISFAHFPGFSPLALLRYLARHVTRLLFPFILFISVFAFAAFAFAPAGLRRVHHADAVAQATPVLPHFGSKTAPIIDFTIPARPFMMLASMKTNRSNASQISPVTRRTFLKNGMILTAGIAALSPAARAQTNKNSKLRIFQIGAGVAGSIGGMQRGQLKGYARCEFVGFCDVDSAACDKVAAEYPGSWKIIDYREAFANRVNDFDAVIVDTPDYHHAPMMLHAMKHRKHIYGQKPLVHQLDELRLIKEGLDARPELITQMGNQRSCGRERMQAVEMLRTNQLGKPIEAYVWTGGVERGHYFTGPWSEYTPAKPVPSTLNWDLWNGPLEEQIPYSDDIHPRRWRTFWETGGGQLADWGCHLLDALYFAYDLPSPEAVVTYTIKPPNAAHAAYCQSVLTYPGGGKFGREKFVVHYNDSSQQPSFAALGLPPMKVGANHTMVVCEEGTLLLQADGKTTIFRKGKVVEDEPTPEVGRRDHWKDWVDNCLGDKKPLWTPFQIGVRITEPALLAVKATKFPGTELRWDAKAYRFTNHDRANDTLLKRNYRAGFEPPKVA